MKNRKTKAPFNIKADKISGAPLMTARIAAEAMQNGLYLMAWYDNLVIAPPLIITESQVDKALAILDKALRIADAEDCDPPAIHSSDFIGQMHKATERSARNENGLYPA